MERCRLQIALVCVLLFIGITEGSQLVVAFIHLMNLRNSRFRSYSAASTPSGGCESVLTTATNCQSRLSSRC